ncbi:MAG: 5-oxoprolinase subunit PxpB [Spirochaetales bacterium]|nr:MAG: 5-oxoprolinase subunit PxpB [Spirochaetales bacterium]
MVRILVSSDQSLCVEFGNDISEEINNQVRAYTIVAEQAAIEGVVEYVPTYRSVTVHYRPEVIGYAALKNRLMTLTDKMSAVEIPLAQIIDIPVLYGDGYGPDLAYVAQINDLTEQEVINIHSKPEYIIYMLGFTPGFCYLGGMDPRISTPRLQVPRVKIPAGSVGIAGSQTGIYPVDSPGGWQLIGQTPLRMYDPNRERPILLDSGMHLRYFPIDQAEFDHIHAEQYGERDANK